MTNLHRRYLIVAITVVTLITLFGLRLSYGSRQIERRGATTQVFVEEVIPVSKSLLMETLEKSIDRQFHGLRLIKKGDNLFPSDDIIKQCCLSDTAIQEYVAIDEKLRGEDYYLHNALDTSWPSEYYYNGKQTMFSCNFIIHLQAIGDSKTKIRLVEVFPKILAGSKFYILGRAGPGFYFETQMVKQTTQDRVELMNLIKTLLGK